MRDFGYLNSKIEEHIMELEKNIDISLEDYISLMTQIYKMSLKVSQESNRHKDLFRKNVYSNYHKKGISFDETIRIVLKFLNTVDSKLVPLFEEAIDNGVILFHTEKELKNLSLSKDNFYYFYNVAGTYNGKYIVNIVLKNTIVDLFTIIHEFMHYVSMNSLDKKSLSWFHFTEGYSLAFEKLLFVFLSEQPKWFEQAKKYYMEVLYSMNLRNFEFQSEFICLDVFLSYGSFTSQKVFKYLEGEKSKEQLATKILSNARISERFILQNEKTLREYLEDSRYVIAVPFSECIVKSIPKEKNDILSDIYHLEEKTFDYFFDKYDLNDKKVYQKVFRI